MIISVESLGYLFASILGLSIFYVICLCFFTNKSVFDVCKSERYRLIGNGSTYKIQQRFFIIFWADYYGFAVKRDNGTLDITLETEEQAVEIFKALQTQAVENKKKNQWTVIAQ